MREGRGVSCAAREGAPGLKIIVRDVQKDPTALERLKELARGQKRRRARVPRDLCRRPTHRRLLRVGAHRSTDPRGIGTGRGATPAAASHEAGTCEAEESLACPKSGGAEIQAAEAPPAEQFQVEVFGRTITLDDVGLPAFTLAMGLLDGFNPCSMWVLLLMISLLAPLNDRRRMLAIAGTFVLVEGHRLLPLHGRLAEPVPADRTLARVAAGHCRHRDRCRPHQREGFLRVQVGRHIAGDSREGQARHLQPHAQHPARRKPEGRRDRRRASWRF